MSNKQPVGNVPLSDDELLELESELEQSLDAAELGADLAFPPLASYQEARRQRLRRRPQSAKKPKDSYHHGNLRQSLLLIAMEQAVAKGIAQLSLRGIAKQAGVSAPALYRHFKDKEALLAAVAIQGYEELLDWLKFAAPENMQPSQRLSRLCQAYLEFMKAYPLYYQLMFGFEIQDRSQYAELMSMHENLTRMLVDLVLEARSAGYFKETLATDRQLTLFWSALQGYTHLYILGLLGQDIEPAQGLKDLIQSLFAGL